MRTARKRISVLCVSTSLDGGGAQRFTSNLVNHLDRSRFRPALCLLRPEFGFPLRSDVAVDCLDYHRRPWQVLSATMGLRRLVAKIRPDVLLSNITATNLITGASLWGFRHRPRWIARIGSDPLRHDGYLRRLLARRIYLRADRIIANAHGLVAASLACYPLDQGKIGVLPNPTDFDALDLEAAEKPVLTHEGDGPLLIAVGRLHPEKRYDILLRACAKVRETSPATLWICGDGPLRNELETLSTNLGLRDSVRFLGFCRNPFALIRQADCFVMTSEHEGLPNVLIEAQGLGLPVVCTDCPHGPREIVDHGKTGFLVPVNDPLATADAILRVTTVHAVRRAMSTEARARARERFGVAKVVREWERVIANVAGRERDD